MMLYWYHPPDYWTYMEFTEKVNHEILTRFNEEGIEFAFPTQTLYLANDEKRQLAVRLLKEQS
jgi:MscS family membrane protein